MMISAGTPDRLAVSAFSWAVAFFLIVSMFAVGESASAQRASDFPPHADTTGESDVYPVGDAVGVYHAILDLLYVDGNERPGVIVMWDTAQRQSGGPCSWRCLEPWPHKSKIDTATILAYTRQSWKRPRIVNFGYRKIQIVLVSDAVMERLTHEGYGYLAHQPADRVGQGEAHWEGFRRKYPTAWGRVMLGKVGFNPEHTEALIGVYHACGLNCGSFETVFLRRVGKQWRVIERVPEEIRREGMVENLRYRGPAVGRKHESQIVAIDSRGSQPRAEATDAAKIYVAVLDKLYSSFGKQPRQIVVATTRAHGPPGLPPHRSKIDSETIGMYDAYVEMTDALYPRFKHRVPIAWISDTTLRVMQGEPPGEPMFRMTEGQSPEMWATFRSKYPGAWGYARLGRVGFNPEHTQALVLTQHYCGESCVNTDTWFLERTREVWYVVERMPRHGEKGYPMDGLRYLGADADPKWFRPRRVRAQFNDVATGKPLVRHDVEFFPADGKSKFVQTDANGWYVLEKPPLTAYIMRAKCPAKSLTDWVFAGGLGITPGIDTTLDVRVNFAECAPPPPAEPELAPNAPPDQPVEATRECIWRAIDRDMQPYIAQARATWPDARKRYLAGLPPRHGFFVTALLIDDSGRREQVFIAVESIHDGQITGKIWNRVEVVRGYQHGQSYTLAETQLRDWTITRPDGTEEGNFVGKFLDEYEAPGGCDSESD